MFGKGNVTQAQLADVMARIDTRIAQQDSVIRTLEAEQLSLHQQVHKWMKRAVAAERAAGRNQERPSAAAATPAPRTLTPARARAYMQGRSWGETRNRTLEDRARLTIDNGDDSEHGQNGEIDGEGL